MANRGQIVAVVSGPSDCTKVTLFVFRPRWWGYVPYVGWCGKGAERRKVEVHSVVRGGLGSGVVCVPWSSWLKARGGTARAIRRASTRRPEGKPVDGGLPVVQTRPRGVSA